MCLKDVKLKLAICFISRKSELERMTANEVVLNLCYISLKQ